MSPDGGGWWAAATIRHRQATWAGGLPQPGLRLFLAAAPERERLCASCPFLPHQQRHGKLAQQVRTSTVLPATARQVHCAIGPRQIQSGIAPVIVQSDDRSRSDGGGLPAHGRSRHGRRRGPWPPAPRPPADALPTNRASGAAQIQHAADQPQFGRSRIPFPPGLFGRERRGPVQQLAAQGEIVRIHQAEVPTIPTPDKNPARQGRLSRVWARELTQPGWTSGATKVSTSNRNSGSARVAATNSRGRIVFLVPRRPAGVFLGLVRRLLHVSRARSEDNGHAPTRV